MRSIRDLLGPLGRAGELDGGRAGDPGRAGDRIAVGGGPAARRWPRSASGAAGIVVGTHALLYERVEFPDLGLVVVDEQHRFGVEQRDALRAKADQPPHLLVMTATPIPRTVAMTVFGDLETSTLTELPGGRSPIATHVVPAADKPAFLAARLAAGCAKRSPPGTRRTWCARASAATPAVGRLHCGPTTADRRTGRPIAVLDVAPLLARDRSHGLRVGVLHGRLPADEKDAVMRDFAAGELDVLVATTVVEVGVDVPNATVMVVLDADRFGVSQLHQLRGRVGRGSAPGLCLLVTEAPGRARPGSGWTRSPPPWTVSSWPSSTWSSAARATCSARRSPAAGRTCGCCPCCATRELIAQARQEAIDLLHDDPDLDRHPALAATVAALVDDERADYLEKGDRDPDRRRQPGRAPAGRARRARAPGPRRTGSARRCSRPWSR